MLLEKFWNGIIKKDELEKATTIKQQQMENRWK
jgi:hypothetical protein